jgi:hypothetical protein
LPFTQNRAKHPHPCPSPKRRSRVIPTLLAIAFAPQARSTKNLLPPPCGRIGKKF